MQKLELSAWPEYSGVPVEGKGKQEHFMGFQLFSNLKCTVVYSYVPIIQVVIEFVVVDNRFDVNHLSFFYLGPNISRAMVIAILLPEQMNR